MNSDIKQLKQMVGDITEKERQRYEVRTSAKDALNNLVTVCAKNSGQGYKLRALLYSLWNGKPVSLLNTLELDWELKRDLCVVIAAFGNSNFFYNEMEAAFAKSGLREWFLEEEDVQ